jgi:predicted transcriptional regulator
MRLLEEHPEWTQRDIAESVKRSVGLINKTFKEMELDGLVKRAGVGAGTTYSVTNKGRAKLRANPGDWR